MGSLGFLASTTRNEQLVPTGPIIIWGFGRAATLARTSSMSKPELEYNPFQFVLPNSSFGGNGSSPATKGGAAGAEGPAVGMAAAMDGAKGDGANFCVTDGLMEQTDEPYRS